MIHVKAAPMNEEQLKRTLSEVKKGEISWAEVNEQEVISSMMAHIGSLDAKLRDDLIFSTFAQVIVEKNQLGAELMGEMMDLCVQDLLFKGIKERGTDTVFTRSFTSLLMALLLYRDKEDDFLSGTKVVEVKEAFLRYLSLEEDYRGYVKEKGWAHSIAHVADAVDELVKNKKTDSDAYPELFRALWSKVLIYDHAYIHGEEERILTPFMEMLNRGLSITLVENQMKELSLDWNEHKNSVTMEQYLIFRNNAKAFLKSLYFQLNQNSPFYRLQRLVEGLLGK
ncbi:DUF2785 domain-containing protein [Halobacillus faecis]|uniref:Membrane protein n=1 Tax=Halobacillus faecis TaxID=360184 RepID=A0A511WNH4_9BACI|nr:DUF2785 domain-containing protein [Halobacillus faecis]GEN52694.1 membrane protein [Halobacillus faecis]